MFPFDIYLAIIFNDIMKILSGRLFYKIVLVFFLFFQALYIFLYKSPSIVDSGALTAASDTLSNSRLSYYAKVSGAYNLGVSFFTIQSSSNPDNNTNHLFPNDTVNIGNNLSMTVATNSAATQFSTTANTTAQLADGDPVTASQSAVHTVTFTTASAVTNPVFRIYIPAGTNTAASNDSGVDGGATAGFDLNLLNANAAANITCISNGTVSPQWGEYSATPSATIGNNTHAVECHYHGALAAGQNVTFTIGNTVKLINPAPRSIHTQGLADTYTIKIKEYQYPSMTEVDTINASVSPVEAVLVSATVNPSLTFQISGIASGVTRCGTATTIPTTATAVSFGDLTGSDTFYHAAHQISTATNATSGYIVKVAQNDELTKIGTSTRIVDTTCNGGGSACTYSTEGKWSSASNYGWGYSLENSTATAIAFEHNSASGNCDGTSGACSKQFACNDATNCTVVGNNAAQTVANSTAPNAAQIFYLCYRLDYGPTQATGYYQTKVMYYPLATF